MGFSIFNFQFPIGASVRWAVGAWPHLACRRPIHQRQIRNPKSEIRNHAVPRAARGTVLAGVLVVSAMAAMLAASLLYRMQAERRASIERGTGQQAYLTAMSGIRFAAETLRAAHADPTLLAEPDLLTDNPTLFRNRLVYNDGVDTWYFTVYAPSFADSAAARYGVSDEAGRINLNTADEATLGALPGMTPDRLDALLDYRDRDDEPRPQGAEQEYYLQLTHPYVIRNGALATVEELLLVRGFTGLEVYGEDHNLNGVLDACEDDGLASFPPDDGDGQLDRGLLDLCTVLSYEPDVDSEGNPRVNLNGGEEDLNRLGSVGLPEQTVQFIRQYRQEGNRFRDPVELLGMRYQLRGTSEGGRRSRRNRRDQQSQQPSGQWIESGVGAEQLPLVLDRLSTQPAGPRGPIPRLGRVNVNTAPLAVLAAVGGLGEATAGEILAARARLDPSRRATTAWIYSENLLGADAFKTIAPLLTARSFQYRVRCVGFAVPRGRFCVLEAIVDVAQGEPRIVYLRELTRLGAPVPLAVEGME